MPGNIIGKSILAHITTPYYADYHVHDNAVATVINTVDIPHLIQGLFSVESIKGFTFYAGSTGSITNTADNGSGLLRCTTAAPHGLSTADVLNTSGLTTAAQNKITRVTVVDASNFDCDDIPFLTGAETGEFYEGDKLVCNSGASGIYKAEMHMFGKSSVANKIFEFELYKNVTPQDNVEAKNRFSTNTTETMGGGGIITLAEGDVITVGVINNTDTTNFTIEHLNVVLHNIE